MTWLVRAGWALTSFVFAAIASSILHVTHTGAVPFALLAAVAVLAVVRPRWALVLLAALIPIAWYSASQLWNSQVAWAEAVTCAALAGFGADAARRRERVPASLAWPAAVFGVIVAGALAASLRVMEMREGSALWGRLAGDLTHVYFTDHSLTAIHAGLLLLEGILLFAHAARLTAGADTLRLICGGATTGAALAAACTLRQLYQDAAHAGPFWPHLFALVSENRWNVHYYDLNAAGSFYALTLLIACGLIWTSTGGRRALWTGCAVIAALGLWLTSSRVALVAAPAAAAAALLLPRAAGGRRRALAVVALAAFAGAALAGLAIALPQRGIQQSSLVSADVRVGLIRTGLRMIRAYPAFGIGLGEFYPKSAEYSSPELLKQFPIIAMRGENAHNNFIQIAAETGIAGGLAFAWTIAAALLLVARRAVAERDRLFQLAFGGLAAFVLTMTAGHPLLVPEPGYIFWLLAGAAAGASAGGTAVAATVPVRRHWKVAAVAALAAVVLTVPLRIDAAARDADLEHISIGMSPVWQVSPDGIRYKAAEGEATIYVPAGAFKFSVNPRGASTRLEIVIDGRVADVRDVQADQWNDLVIPARTVQSDSRFRRMDLRTAGTAHPPIWVTKIEPILQR